MKRIFALMLALGLLFSAPACSGEKGDQPAAAATATASPAAGPVFRTIPPQEARVLIAQRRDLQIIDVRGPEELREGFIANSRLVPFWAIARNQQTLPVGPPLLLVCAVGGRSYAVGQYLYQKGYREVYNLQGGIDNWKRAGLPLQYP